MILQCDQCNTKFRLDDSKLKPGGVKVRCSKCRHVFLAGAEQKLEESEFDAILSGLGAQIQEKPEETPSVTQEAGDSPLAGEPAAEGEIPAPAAPQSDISGFAAFDFPAEPVAPQGTPAPPTEEQADLGAFESVTEPSPQQEAPSAAASPGLDFSEFAFLEEPVALKEEPPAKEEAFDFGEFSFAAEPAATVAKTEEPAPAAPGSFDFGEFDFDAEPVVQPQEANAPAGEGLDFGEFSFSEEPAPKLEEPPVAAHDALDFGEFSFEESAPKLEEPSVAAHDALDFGEFSFEEPAPKQEEPPVAAHDALDFGEFSFEESAPKQEEPPVAAHDALDFGDFSFEEPAPKQEEPPVAAHDALDFGEFSFAEEPAQTQEEPPVAAHDALDFGEFSFAEEPAVKTGEPPSPADEAINFDEFSFAEEPPFIKEAPADDDFGAFSFPDESQQKQEAVTAPAAGATFTPGDFSFSRDFSEMVAPAAAEPSGAPDLAEAPAQMAAGKPATATSPVSPSPAQETKLDFGYGAKPSTAQTPEQGEFEEELPPLSISSRRKGRSLLTVSIVTLSVLVVVALSGAGLYLLQSGPAAMETFDKAGLGFVAKWFGMESPEEGRITIRNPQAAFHQNKEAGEIFVVTGDVVNTYRKARASIHVKVSLFDNKGAVLMQKTAYCGNRLSSEQLATLPMAKIESIMNNQFGDSLSNLGVKPGQAIGFVVAVSNVPKEAVDFGVEVVGSTVAGQ